MRRLGVIGSVCLAALLLAGPGAGAERQGRAKPAADLGFVPGELIVQFRPGVSSAARRDAIGSARVAGSLGAPGLTLVRLANGASVSASAAALARDPRVAFAEPNYVYRLSAVPPNDPSFPDLWGMSQVSDFDIDAPEAWDTVTGDPSIRVGVIDSGVAYDHPDLAGNMWVNPGEIAGNGLDDDLNGFIDDVNGWDFVQEDNAPLDANGHGTHVAGTIGAVGNNGDGVAGVNWDVSLMALRAGDASGSLTSTDIFQAVQYACNNEADVVNGSFGGPGKSVSLGNLLKSAACRNTLFVFAAGNDGAVLTNNTAATNAYPCEYHRPAPHGFSVPNIICVAASTRADALATFSNRGPAAVHLAAPGGNGSGTPSQEILSTWPEFDSIFADDLEAGFTSWTGAGGTGSWSRTSELSVSGLWSMTDSPGGNYQNDRDTTIRNAAALDLSGGRDCSVDYALRVVIRDILGNEVFDWFSIEAATSSSGPWQELNFYAGNFGAFVTEDLSAFDGASTVYLRFLVHSDDQVRDEGAHVDDVLVKCVIPNGEDYEAIPGTSMASPHVAGVAALLLDANPALTVAKLKNAILKGVDKKVAFANRVSTGGRLNADKSIDIALDMTPPNTTITGRPPASTTSRRATFRFRSTETGSTFQCRHMNGSWMSCTSPKLYTGLTLGLHRFRVRAIDKALNVDPTPATDTWRIRR